MQASEHKAELRLRLREELARVSPQEAAERAARLTDRVLGLPEVSRARGVLSCLSFGAEVDTWRLVERLQAAGKQLYVPRADPRGRRLHVHPYPCELCTLSFGLRQPLAEAPALAPEEVTRQVDAALVLGLGFDRRGYRLGYGAGYFDRFLAGKPFPAIGLAYDLQIVDEVPAEPHDVPMEVVVTESEVIRP